jgi:hypothetical protein
MESQIVTLNARGTGRLPAGDYAYPAPRSTTASSGTKSHAHQKLDLKINVRAAKDEATKPAK